MPEQTHRRRQHLADQIEGSGFIPATGDGGHHACTGTRAGRTMLAGHSRSAGQ